MDTKFKTSFIPKKPIVPSVKMERRAHPTDFFSLFANLILILSLLASGGAFGYQWYLSNRITTLGAQLDQIEKSFEPELIAKLSNIDDRLNSAKDIFGNHISTIALFELLEAATMQNVQFTSFDYFLEPDGITLELSGQARSYSTLVLQSDELINSKYVESIVFSNLDLDSSGNVLFYLRLQLDKTGFLYKNNLQTLSFNGFPF